MLHMIWYIHPRTGHFIYPGYEFVMFHSNKNMQLLTGVNRCCFVLGRIPWNGCSTVYPKKYAHGFGFAVLCCGYTLADFPISIRLTSLALWQSNDCPSASKATLMNMDKYFMWIHYERLHNHNKAKHNKTVCIFLGIYCSFKQSNTLMKIHEIYSARYIQLTHFLYDDCENMCTLPYYHPYVCHCELTSIPSDDL